MNLEKLARLTGDLDELNVTRRGITDHHRDLRDDFIHARASIHKSLHASGRKLIGWTEADGLAALLKFDADDLRDCNLDVPTIKAAIAMQDRMRDLQARSEALTAQITPLSELIGSLNKYVKAHTHG